ncbi:hypothetical protein CLG_0002 (plasmid) [Clostridium botulinum D str. 1873]|uniref:Uncharacterized protein n=1 Tax=Clostridium botulinum D str. 1873 TaxID=592027 RepID=A0A9N7AT67_CLOBO|nr:hypothetical protein CLG_0002 [Clostridium botulinum D str. 1873]
MLFFILSFIIIIKPVKKHIVPIICKSLSQLSVNAHFRDSIKELNPLNGYIHKIKYIGIIPTNISIAPNILFQKLILFFILTFILFYYF